MPKAKPKYRVVARVSTRRSPDPASPDYESWIDYEPGDVIAHPPEHLPIAELLASGHLESE